jgi:hypothetical protein
MRIQKTKDRRAHKGPGNNASDVLAIADRPHGRPERRKKGKT